MNIKIYYLSKTIIIHQKNQQSQNQSFKSLDELKNNELKALFELFINQTDTNELIFYTDSLDNGIDKFRKAFTIIYAAGGLIQDSNKYLFIYRLNKWDLPKGKLDLGESPEEAAIRECEEECGISKLSILNELPSTYHMYQYKGGYALKKTFWYAMQTQHKGTLIPQIEENIEKVEWFDKTQISNKVIDNTYPAIIDVITHLLD